MRFCNFRKIDVSFLSRKLNVIFLFEVLVFIPSPMFHCRSHYLPYSVSFGSVLVQKWVRGSKDTSEAKINWALLESFVECFGTLEFSVSLNDGSLDFEPLLCRVRPGTAAPKRAIQAILTLKSQRRTLEQLAPRFVVSEGRLF